MPSSPHRSAAAVLEPLIEEIFHGPIPVRIEMWDGSTLGPRTDTAIRLESPVALRRLLWAPGELGLSRADVAGDLQLDGSVFDLLELRDALVDNDGEVHQAGISVRLLPRLLRVARDLDVLGGPPAPPSVEAKLNGFRHLRGRDAEAISHHYDVGNDFYRLVLGPSLTYSCAYWARDDFTLEDAQEAKYELISRKLDLKPGMRLLDVGCGWGGMVLHAAQHHGVTAVGVTLSQEQAVLARERIAEAGLADKIEIRVQDYRDIHDGPFDAISSIGMFEHVGLSRAEEYFEDLYELLAPGARLLNHAISRPDPSKAAIRASLVHGQVRVPRCGPHRGGHRGFRDAETPSRSARCGIAPRALRQDAPLLGAQSRGKLGPGPEVGRPRPGAGVAPLHGRIGSGIRGGPHRHPPGPRRTGQAGRHLGHPRDQAVARSG